jgi:hypothetical protein
VQAFEQLLAKHDVARHESLSEKFILCCLFARKLDVDRTAGGVVVGRVASLVRAR